MSDDIYFRPECFYDFIGQSDSIEALKIYVASAIKRKESLDHVLLFGPPGLGKTTLANIIANELGVNIRKVSAPTLERPADIVCVLSALNPGDILFIDEIHRLPIFIEEILYSAMEDFRINVILNKETESKNLELELPPFTLVGATTNYGLLSTPLRNRFGIKIQFNYYNEIELSKIIQRTSKVYDFPLDEKSSLEIAKRSRFTPRIANFIYKRIRDVSTFDNKEKIEFSDVLKGLKILKIDELGLEYIDRLYLKTLVEKYDGGPAGLDSISNSMNESAVNIEEYIEPYLLQIGLISRTNRGRILTHKGLNHIKQFI